WEHPERRHQPAQPDGGCERVGQVERRSDDPGLVAVERVAGEGGRRGQDDRACAGDRKQRCVDGRGRRGGRPDGRQGGGREGNVGGGGRGGPAGPEERGEEGGEEQPGNGPAEARAEERPGEQPEDRGARRDEYAEVVERPQRDVPRAERGGGGQNRLRRRGA